MARADLSPKRLALYVGTFALAALGGYVAHLLHVPLAWMIGAMLAVCGAGLAGLPVAAPSVFRPAAMIVLGTSFGQAFTPPVLAALASTLPVLIGAGFASLLTGAVASRITARIGRLDTKTAYFVSIPGGIIPMIVLAAQAGASIPAVTLGQTLRMVLVVLTYPLAMGLFAHPGGDVFAFIPPPVFWPMVPLLLALTTLGALITSRTRIANPWMMGPVFVSLGLAVAGTPLTGLPSVIIDAAQVAMGASLGTRLTRDFLMKSRRLLVASIANMAILSGFAIAIAVASAMIGNLPVPAALLGTAPGGLPEMSITAKVMNLGVPLVVGFHLVRLLICNLFVIPLYEAIAWAERKLGRSPPEKPEGGGE